MHLSRTAKLLFGLALPATLTLAARQQQQHQQQQQQPHPHFPHQAPIMADRILPGDTAAHPSVATDSQPLLLSDTLGAQRSLSIFASLARDDMNASAQFSDQQGYTIVLAPTNTALKAMDHKPWEDPQADGGHASDGKGDSGMDRANRNIRRFVQSCLVITPSSGGSEWPQGQASKRVRGGGEGGQKKEVWWETREGKTVIMPEEIAVESVVSRVVNGEVWALEGTFES